MPIDKVKPLKIEETGNGTELDMDPTEMNPTEDYASVKGISIENSDNLLVDSDGTEIQFTDTVSGTKKVSDLLDAEQEDFDAGATDLVSTKTGPAIRELRNKITNSASPGYSFGRSGNISTNTWLFRPGSVPSNKTGITIGFANPEIKKVNAASEDADTYNIGIYEHDGDEINLTLLTTLSVTASRSETFDISVSATQGKQLAVRITSGSVKNPGIDLELSGDFT